MWNEFEICKGLFVKIYRDFFSFPHLITMKIKNSEKFKIDKISKSFHRYIIGEHGLRQKATVINSIIKHLSELRQSIVWYTHFSDYNKFHLINPSLQFFLCSSQSFDRS